jgi:riboflavin kinase / FMN adenylyltransferase
MKYTEPFQAKSLDELKKYNFRNIVAAIGVFDGIHLGHRKLIKTLLEMADNLKADPVIITFFPHPRKVLMHEENLRFLRNPEEKLNILKKLGIKAVVTIPFTQFFASLPPPNFIKHFMLPDTINLKGICVGSKWKFGKSASGNTETLHRFAEKYKFKFIAVNELFRNNQLVSSTAIRKALKESNFHTANFMLDCIYSITGKIKNSEFLNETLYLNVHVDFGILPPKGEYTIYIKQNFHKIKTYAHVISENSINICDTHARFGKKNIEFEFIEKIDL